MRRFERDRVAKSERERERKEVRPDGSTRLTSTHASARGRGSLPAETGADPSARPGVRSAYLSVVGEGGIETAHPGGDFRAPMPRKGHHGCTPAAVPGDH